jgi:RNA polymerase sigma-70 factor (ECF subfamily)
MTIINLRDWFPDENIDCVIEVPDSDAEAFKANLTIEAADIYFDAQRQENAYQRRRRWHKANYSLDTDDGIEIEAVNKPADPFEIISDQLVTQKIYEAVAGLPENQGRRIRAHYFFGVSMAQIAEKEGLSKQNVSKSINKGLAHLKKILKNFV